MAYQVDKFNGSFLTSVEDGTIDTTTDLRFVGKNYAGYGEVQNENFLHLLENFANTTSPPKSIAGQIWYDSSDKRLRFYDGSKFKYAGGAEVSTTAPSGLQAGEFWWDTSAKQLYTWSGTEFVLVGPDTSPDLGTSAITAQVVKDTGGTNHTILKMTSAGNVVALVSSTAFDLNNSLYTDLNDFNIVKKGLTLAKTNAEGRSSDEYVFWGTASNSDRLGGINADQYVRTDTLEFSSEVSFGDNGFTVGNLPDHNLTLSIVDIGSSDIILFKSDTKDDMVFRFRDPDNLLENDVMKIQYERIIPGSDNEFDFGSIDSTGQQPSEQKRWRNIYAATFVGNVTGNVTGNSTGTHVGDVKTSGGDFLINASQNEIGNTTTTYNGIFNGRVVGSLEGSSDNATTLQFYAPSAAVPGTLDKSSVPLRDTSGNLYAVQFIGTADKADRLRINNGATDTDPDYRSAKTTATVNTIVARDGSADIYANLFQGTATAARYADLAEKYLTDKEYEIGTVVMVGGEAEVTACSKGSHAIGVVSENPAFMMNKDLEGGTYIALKGRVPVKVGGKVNKGDTLVAGQNGYAVVGNDSHVIAIALESSDSESVKLVEAVIL